MTPAEKDLGTLSSLNKRFIHNFVTNDVPSHDAILHPLFRTIGTQGNHMDRAGVKINNLACPQLAIVRV